MFDASGIFDGTVSAGSIGTIGSQTSQVTGVGITATTTSTNIIDWLTGRDVGAAEPLGLHVQILQAFTTTNSATLQISYQVCDTTNGTYLDLVLSPPIPVAQLIIGAPVFRYALPVNQILNATAGILKKPGQYAQLKYTVGTGVFTLGKVFSYLTPRLDRGAYYSYPAAYTVAIASGEI